LEKQVGGNTNESQTFREAHVREVQDHQAQGQSHGHLREPEAQAASGLICLGGPRERSEAAASQFTAQDKVF
jgi:hypothetical protein